MVASLPGSLTGSYLVRALRPAFHDAHRLFPRMRDRAVLRRQTLKLRFWPERHVHESNDLVMDLDWSWIRALRNKNVGELRIHDTIGNHDNIRVIFFNPEIHEPLPILWVLAVMQKKRDDFTTANISTFDLRRQLVIERFYST